MCLVVIALGASERFPLVVAANRDERHSRPALPAHWWADRPHVLAGRDLSAGGSWLAMDHEGRLAAVTNVREPAPTSQPRSRGALVADFLAEPTRGAQFAQALAATAQQYSAFNLLLYDGHELIYTSNRAAPAALARGLHALSNAPRGESWPKISTATKQAAAALSARDPEPALFEMLSVRAPDSAEDSYRTAHFVVGPVYGTRCSTVILCDAQGRVSFAERRFDPGGYLEGETRESFVLAQSRHSAF